LIDLEVHGPAERRGRQPRREPGADAHPLRLRLVAAQEVDRGDELEVLLDQRAALHRDVLDAGDEARLLELDPVRSPADRPARQRYGPDDLSVDLDRRAVLRAGDEEGARTGREDGGDQHLAGARGGVEELTDVLHGGAGAVLDRALLYVRE